jgi:hypothetical protein
VDAKVVVDTEQEGVVLLREGPQTASVREDATDILETLHPVFPLLPSLAPYCPGVVVLSSSVRMNGAGRVGWLLWPSTSTLPSKVTRPVAVASRRFVVLVLIRKP